MLDNALIDLIEHDKPYNVEFKMRRLSDGRIIDIQSLAEYDPKMNCVWCRSGVTERTSRKAIAQIEKSIAHYLRNQKTLSL